jgi:hypothetical protein
MAHTIKTFRGLLQDGQQERIALQHIDGTTGYRIKKFQIMPRNFNTTDEYNMSVWSIKQTALVTTFNFSNNTLLAAGYFENETGVNGFDESIVFEGVTINQDIFVSHKSQSGNSCNYYLELEVIHLSDVEATATILKNFRNTNTVA